MARQFLPLSPAEVERLKQEEQKKQKLARLQEVREQERRLAAERRSRYRQAAGSEWVQTISRLEEGWIAQKQVHIKSLEELQDAHSNHVGIAHRTASIANGKQDAIRTKLYDTTINRQKLELERGLKAQLKEEEGIKSREAPIVQRRTVMAQTRLAENDRAHRLASDFRIRRATSAPDAEVPSIPQSRRLLQERSGKAFDDTCIHRDFVVTRSDVVAPKPNAWKSAQNAAVLQDTRERERGRRAELLKERAQKRYQRAVLDIHMNKHKTALMETLDELYDEDRQRKVKLAGRQGATVDPHHIDAYFAEMFQIME